MQPADFTIEFYRKCLSQAKWESDDFRDKESVFLLIHVANERGGEFSDAYWTAYAEHTKQFPVAAQPATENPQQKTNTDKPMNTLLNDIYEILIKPLVEAIDRNTASKPTAALTTVCENPPTESEDKPAEPVKKRGPKAKAEAAPAPEPTPEPAPVVEEEPYLSGTELVELMKPLKDTKYTKLLVDFRNDTLGFAKMTREMSDPDMLRQMEAKIREYLAANEEDQKEV
jgi:hypothetical protein